jgi:ArsR family transcriptional regulator, arsenate/arsenite/antimonite-responsive transcriptional repressor
MKNDEFVAVSKALSDGTRVQILRIISKSKTICACKILEELRISQGTLSHHMKVLTDLKLVSVEKNGKWRYYSLIRKNICEIAHFVQSICKEEGDQAADSCACR